MVRNADVSKWGERWPITNCPNGDIRASYVPDIPGRGNVARFIAACVNGQE